MALIFVDWEEFANSMKVCGARVMLVGSLKPSEGMTI